jgi:hypothetical protein
MKGQKIQMNFSKNPDILNGCYQKYIYSCQRKGIDSGLVEKCLREYKKHGYFVEVEEEMNYIRDLEQRQRRKFDESREV